MKKFILKLTALAAGISFLFSTQIPVCASDNGKEAGAVFDELQDKLSEAFSNIDEETAEEVFDFLKEKAKEGSLETRDGLESVIKEGEKKFGVEINDVDAGKIVDTMEKLEELGFSMEKMIDKAEEIYEKYGSDFAKHTDEIISEALKEVVTETTGGFFRNLWESAKNFFKKIFFHS